jgi:hypothetical protein
VTFSALWKRLSAAFLETANLVALTIIVVASFLTGDVPLVLVGAGMEVAYLIWKFLSAPYRTRIESRAGKPDQKPLDRWLLALTARTFSTSSDKPSVKPLDCWLLIVTVAGFVVILFFGFGKHLLTHRWYYLTHAQGWEAGAIGWTGLFLVYYLFKVKDTKYPNVNRAIIILIAGFGYPLVEGLKNSMQKPIEHVAYVLAIGACFLVIDLLVVIFHHVDDEKNRSLASLVGADIPMLVAFTVLLLYLWVHGDAEEREVFVSGVVAFQLLFSNAVFVVTEFALLRPPKFASFGEQGAA